MNDSGIDVPSSISLAQRKRGRGWLSLGLILSLCLCAGLVWMGFSRHVFGSSRKASVVPLPNPQNVPLFGPIRFQGREITIHVIANVHLHVHSTDALLEPALPNQPVTLDKPDSMKVTLLSADTYISAQDLTTLLNNYALPQSNLPIRDVEVTFSDGQVQMRGKVHKLIELPFTASAAVGVTPHGNVALHFDKISVAGLLHKKLLDLLGLNIADLAKSDSTHSFHIHGDDVDFPIHVLFPAPHFSGHLTSATIVGDNLVQVFGDPKPFPPAPVPAEHYIYFRGGVLNFGRLTMNGVDLEMLDKDADQTFELSLQDVFRQVLPGYLKNLPDHGLVAYIQSYSDHPGALPSTEDKSGGKPASAAASK